MNKMYPYLVPLFLFTSAMAEESNFSDELYQEALREVQTGQASPSRSPSQAAPDSISLDAQEWLRSMQLMAQDSLENQMQGKLALLKLMKKLNIFASDEQFASVLATHEAAAKGEPAACLAVAIALIKGEFELLSFPRCPNMALPYLEQLAEPSNSVVPEAP